jgi:hypothetical protein
MRRSRSSGREARVKRTWSLPMATSIDHADDRWSHAWMARATAPSTAGASWTTSVLTASRPAHDGVGWSAGPGRWLGVRFRFDPDR